MSANCVVDTSTRPAPRIIRCSKLLIIKLIVDRF